MKVVLKTLTKLLQTSLSHIMPHSIVAGDRLALRNLLEVFNELIEGMTNFIVKLLSVL